MFIVNNINCVHYCTKGHSDNTLQYDKRQQQDAIPVARIRPGRPETRRELQHAARDPKIPGNCLTQSGFEFGEPFLAELPVNTGRVARRAFPLAELTGRQHGPSTRLVETRARQHVETGL